MILFIYLAGIIINFILGIIYHRSHASNEIGEVIYEALTPLGALFKCILFSIFWPITAIVLIICIPLWALFWILNIFATIILDFDIY